MKKLMLASVILANSQMVMAANWVNTGVSSKIDNEINYIDFDSVSGYYFNNYDKTNYYVTAWIKTDYPTSQKLKDGRLYRERRELWYVDCLAEKITTGDVAVYSSNGNSIASEQNIYVNTYSSSNWDRVIPDTIGDGLAKFICLAYDIKTNPNYYNQQ